MLRLNIILLLMIQLLFSNKINFNYGIVGDLNNKSKKLVDLKDQSEISSGDKIQINLGLVSNTYFYLVYKDTDEKFLLLYEQSKQDKDSSVLDTIYVDALPWSEFEGPPGKEIFYLINSYSPLNDLKKLLTRYENAPKKGKIKLGKKIQSFINTLDPNSIEDLSSIANRLDKPIVGGVAFRGDDEEEDIKNRSLMYECVGENGIAFEKIILNHK